MTVWTTDNNSSPHIGKTLHNISTAFTLLSLQSFFMIEKHFFLEDADPAIFFGAGNSPLRLVRALRPKLRIMGRDNVLKVMGAEEDMAEVEESFKRLQ